MNSPMRHQLRIVERRAFLIEATNTKGLAFLMVTKRRDVGPGGIVSLLCTPNAHAALQFATRECAEDLLVYLEQEGRADKGTFAVTEHIFEEALT